MGSLPQPAPVVSVEDDLSRLSEAAWIIDLDHARVIAASPAGRAIWGGAWQDGASLDRAMPALALLDRLAMATAPERWEEHKLLIWTGQGLVRLRCRCRPLAHNGRKVLVVSGEKSQVAGGEGPAESVPVAPDRGRAMLAHELRTPLGAIVALAEVMKEERLGPMGNARYLVYANDIHESARHALSVIGAMLEGGAGESAAQEPVEADVDETVARCLSALRELAGKVSVRLEADLEPGRPRLAMERRSLMQILLNLLSNALKFTLQGGVVRVGTRRRPDGALVLSVADTGPGMSPEQLAQIQAGELGPTDIGPAPRTGYGLPIVSALARANGGQMEIDSVPGQGTRVLITFPADRLVCTGCTSP